MQETQEIAAGVHAGPPVLTVGQALWYVPSRLGRGEPHETTVREVGRVWARLDNGRRVRIATGAVAERVSHDAPGTLHASKAHWLAECECKELWLRFKAHVAGAGTEAPAGVSVQRLREWTAELLAARG